MKILLDECVTRKAKRHLNEFEVVTVPEASFSGLKNGKLLKAAVEQGFDILCEELLTRTLISKNFGIY